MAKASRSFILILVGMLLLQIACNSSGGNSNEANHLAIVYAGALDRDLARQNCEEYKFQEVDIRDVTAPWDVEVVPDLTSADRLNGITEKSFLRIERACVSEGIASYEDVASNLLIVKQNGNWCVYAVADHEYMNLTADNHLASDQFRCAGKINRSTPTIEISHQSDDALNLHLRTALDQNGDHVTSVFSPSDTIYVLADLPNVAVGTNIISKWYAVNVEGYDPDYMFKDMTYTVTEDSFSGTVYFQLSNDSGWPTGDYKVELYLNNELKQTVNFNVQ